MYCFLQQDLSFFLAVKCDLHHIPQLKGIGAKSPYVAKGVPVSHVKLKSTRTNIIEPLLERERSMMSGWSWHRFKFPLLVSRGFWFFFSSINHPLIFKLSNRYFNLQRRQESGLFFNILALYGGQCQSLCLSITFVQSYLNNHWICVPPGIHFNYLCDLRTLDIINRLTYSSILNNFSCKLCLLIVSKC